MLYKPQKDILVYVLTNVLDYFEKEQDVYICNSIKHLRRTKKITDEDFHLAMNYLYSQMPSPGKFRRIYKHKLFNKENFYFKNRFNSELHAHHMNPSWWSCWYEKNKEEAHRQRIIYLKLLIRNLKR